MPLTLLQCWLGHASLSTTAIYADVLGAALGVGRSVQQPAHQINQAAQDAGFNGTNLLNGDGLTIAFNEKSGAAQSKLAVQGSAITADALGIGRFVDSGTGQAGGDFGVQNNTDLGKAADALTNALTNLKSLSLTLGSNLSVVQTRQDFAKQLVNVLDTGSADLVNADVNEEAATSQALSTRSLWRSRPCRWPIRPIRPIKASCSSCADHGYDRRGGWSAPGMRTCEEIWLWMRTPGARNWKSLIVASRARRSVRSCTHDRM